MTDPSAIRVTGPLMQFAAGFAAELSRQGYTPKGTGFQLHLMAHLSRWLAEEGLDPNRLSAAEAERFLEVRRAAGYTSRVWLAERGGEAEEPLFPTRRGGRLSRDALERRLAKHVATAALTRPSLAEKKVTVHVLRHSAAMRLLEAGVDTSVIALWLGHEQIGTTQIYLHANLAIKERALARTTPPGAKPGRYRPSDAVLAFLDEL